MLNQDVRTSLLSQLGDVRQIQGVSPNQALLDRLMQSRKEMKESLKQEIVEEKKQYNYRQNLNTDTVEIMESNFQSDQKQLNWDDIVNSNDRAKDHVSQRELLSVNQNLQEQLEKSKQSSEQFNQTLRNYKMQVESQSPHYISDYSQIEDRIRNQSDHQKSQVIEVFQNHSDDENVRQYYASSDKEKKKVYLNHIVKKYGQKTRLSENKVCNKHNSHEQKEIFPYKPDTHGLPRQIYGDQGQNKVEVSKEVVWERLLINKRSQLEHRELQKREQDFQTFQERCPFHPIISPISRSLVDATNKNGEELVEDRLVREGHENKRRIEELQRQKYEQEQYSFQPQIDTKNILKGDKATIKPIYERIDDIIKKKQESLLLIRLEQEKQENTTFHPKISLKSSFIADTKLTSKSVIERLMHDAFEKTKRRLQETQEHQKAVSEECTFIPNINPSIENQQREFSHLAQQQFVQKQYLMADYLKEKKENLFQEFMKSQNYTFKPEVNKQSALLVEADPERQSEDLNQKVKRLSQKDHEKKIIIQEQLQEAYYKQFTFKPKMNQISQVIGRKRSFESLAFNKEGQQKLKQLREDIELERKQECSFQPQFQKKDQYSYVQSKYGAENIKENLEVEDQTKKRRIQELQRKLEYDELKECTFKPQTNKDVKIPVDGLQDKVKGLEKFIQNKENQKRKAQDKQDRENEVFNIASRYDERKHQTETKTIPFKLSTGNPNGIRQLQEVAMQREKEECTFMPRINDQKNSQRQFKEVNYEDLMNQL